MHVIEYRFVNINANSVSILSLDEKSKDYRKQ